MNTFTKYLILFSIGVLSTSCSSDKKNKLNDDIITVNNQSSNYLTGYDPISSAKNVVEESVYANPESTPEDRAKDLIARMTFDEKLALTTSVNGFKVAGITRLGIRKVTMADTSQGVRMGTAPVKGKSTSMPGMLPLAATWNVELAKTFGLTMAEECSALGVDILLGPSMNMQRLSVGRRNYEYMGEDPLLTGKLATAYIQGLQSLNIVPTAKHFIANDQEFVRHIANSVVDERTLREIYLLPWEMIIKDADCMGVMSGNNVVNGVPCAMHKPLIGDVLRDEFGFKGVAMTDWQNTRYFPKQQDLVLPSTETIIMPDNKLFAGWLHKEIAKDPSKKEVFEKQLETMIYPNLYTFFKMGIYDRKLQDVKMLETLPMHHEFAQKCAEEAIVLLKNNDKILPIRKNKKVVMLGETELFTGTGSGNVAGYNHVTYAMGLKNVYGSNFTYLEKLDVDEVKNADIVIFNLNKLSGEGLDVSFEEPRKEINQLKELIKLNTNIVVLLNSANTMPTDWLKGVKGVLWCSYLGQARGDALANVVSGEITPSGKLPFTFEKGFKDS